MMLYLMRTRLVMKSKKRRSSRLTLCKYLESLHVSQSWSEHQGYCSTRS